MKSLKNQLLLILSAFVLASLFTALFSGYHFHQREKVFALYNKVDQIEIKLLKAIKQQENYFNFELINSYYFETKESEYIFRYRTIYEELTIELGYLKQNREIEKSYITNISRSLEEFNSYFSQITHFIEERGFKNYGVIGKMREVIHKLEEIEEIDKVQVLTLRRNEKDFLLRQEPVYLEKHQTSYKRLKASIKENALLSESGKKTTLTTLEQYAELFNQLAVYEQSIGLKVNTGLKSKLNNKSNDLFDLLDRLKVYSTARLEKELLKLNIILVVFLVCYILIAMWMSYKVAIRFTKRLNMLSQKLNYFVNTNFTARLKLPKTNRKDEVGKLWNNFILMESEIVDHIELFKERVDAKTFELSEKTKQIQSQQEKILQQKKESDEKNKDLTDGMRYGWRIQRALIPTAKRFKKQVRKGFVFFVPKEIVSGDIYWTYRLKNKGEEESIFSVIDCTGHGVPGAFMSILAVNAINYAVLNKGNTNPAAILKETNNYVFNTMKYYSGAHQDYSTKDGMDMLLCKLNRTKLQLEYSGANRPLYLVRNITGKESEEIGLDKKDYRVNYYKNTLIFEILSTKKTVGTLNTKQSEIFDCKKIKLVEGDMLYLTSDGYADQFGGERNKKFMIRRLKGLMSLIHNIDEQEQKMVIQQSLLDWKRDEDQVDDITIMGVRV